MQTQSLVSHNLGTSGHLLVDSRLRDFDGARVTSEFLEGLVKEYIKLDVKFSRTTGWSTTFWEKEKQMDAVLLPALAGVADALSSQLSIDRKKGRWKTFGFMDCWAYYRKVLFGIEVKHAFLNLKRKKNSTLQKKVVDRWGGARDQLHTFNSSDIEYLEARNVLRVAFMVLAIYDCYQETDRHPALKREDLPKLLGRISDQLKPRPNWAAIWYVPRKLQKRIQWQDDDKVERYQAAAFLFRIFRA